MLKIVSSIAAIIVIVGLVKVCSAIPADWLAKWNANTEPDLAGYKVYINNNPPVDVGMKTEYSFSAGDSVCAYVTAYDLSGNESLPSEVVCAKSAGKVGDFNGDGLVTVGDYNLYFYVVGMDSEDSGWHERRYYNNPVTGARSPVPILAAEMDLNKDGRITVYDLAIHFESLGN